MESSLLNEKKMDQPFRDEASVPDHVKRPSLCKACRHECSNRRPFLECESEAVAFAATTVTPVDFYHNLVIASTLAAPNIADLSTGFDRLGIAGSRKSNGDRHHSGWRAVAESGSLRDRTPKTGVILDQY